MTDQSLLAGYVHARDHKAFELIVTRYQGMVYAVCQRPLNNCADIDDVHGRSPNTQYGLAFKLAEAQYKGYYSRITVSNIQTNDTHRSAVAAQ